MFPLRFCGLTLLLGACGLAAQGGSTAKFQLTSQEEKLLTLTNQERKKHDLPALKPSPVLFKVARAHSANMARQGKMEHVLDGKTPFQRIKAAGYKYSVAGENVAAGDVPMEDIVRAWMKSPKHRDNILGKKFTEIGLGIIPDKEGVRYYTQVFGKPR